MKDTMILKNGTIIELEAGASLGALQVAAADRMAMVATWETLTPDNLATVQIKNGDGTVVGNYTDLMLVTETSVIATDGVVFTTYSLREKQTRRSVWTRWRKAMRYMTEQSVISVKQLEHWQKEVQYNGCILRSANQARYYYYQ